MNPLKPPLPENKSLDRMVAVLQQKLRALRFYRDLGDTANALRACANAYDAMCFIHSEVIEEAKRCDLTT